MNMKLFSIALLISAIPLLASANEKGIILDKGDFISAQRKNSNGDTVISLKLSKSGKAKFKKLNAQFVDKEVHSEIGGISSHFKLRVPITQDQLEMGPYSDQDANKVVTEINNQ